MKETVFDIPKMDCPSEEKIVRMALDELDDVQSLAFDLRARRLTVTHTGESENLLQALQPLGFGTKLSKSRELTAAEVEISIPNKTGEASADSEARVLWQLLFINGFMFVAEMGFGLYGQSAGLIADSLDMFADAVVYGLSLYAVGKAIQHKKRAARMSGYLQVLLALGAILEVLRRSIFGSDPEEYFMMAVAAVALAANTLCLFLLSKHRNGEVHMKASWIFSTNDVIANLGVVVAGALVWMFRSNWPDLVVGLIIGVIVLRGGIRILRLSK